MEDITTNEIKIRELEKTEIAVLRDVRSFPSVTKEFCVPYIVVGIALSGSARLLYDMHEVNFTTSEVSVVMPNHLIQPLEISNDYNVILIVMSKSMLDELKQWTLSRDYSKFHVAPSTQLTPKQRQEFFKVIDMLDMLSQKTEVELPNRHKVLLYTIDVLFELLNSYRAKQDKENHWANRNTALFNKFCDLLAENYTKSREVTFYANKLNLTPKYFSKVIRDTVGITAGDWIEEYIISQAKNVLATRDDLSIQQIAFHLGFNEQASFCRFFKRSTDLSPKAYREKIHQMRAE